MSILYMNYCFIVPAGYRQCRKFESLYNQLRGKINGPGESPLILRTATPTSVRSTPLHRQRPDASSSTWGSGALASNNRIVEKNNPILPLSANSQLNNRSFSEISKQFTRNHSGLTSPLGSSSRSQKKDSIRLTRKEICSRNMCLTSVQIFFS